MIQLIHRTPSFVKGYKEYCQEFYDNNILTFRPTNPKYIDEDWFERTARFYEQMEQGTCPGSPKSLHYWAVDGDRFIGEFQLRPELTDDLMKGIGSIGCSVRVSEWGKGFGTEILKQGLSIAKKCGLKKVLLIIDDDNLASVKVCEANGGILQDKIMADSTVEGTRLVRRYWITLEMKG